MTAKEELRSTPHPTPHPALSRRERVLLTAHEMFQIPTHNVQTPVRRSARASSARLGAIPLLPRCPRGLGDCDDVLFPGDGLDLQQSLRLRGRDEAALQAAHG